MEAILLGLQVVIAIAMIGIVLIQRSDQDGFGLGSGSGANFMTGRQSANLLTRATAWLAAAFMLNCLILTALAASHSELSIVDRIESAQKNRTAVPPQLLEDAASKAFEAGEAPAPAAAPAEVLPAAPIVGEQPAAPKQP